MDFNKLEDQFFCIDVLTRARFALKSSEAELAADIDKIIASLTAITKNPPKNMEVKKSLVEVEAEAKEGIEEGLDSDNNGIVDLLTGNIIR